MEHSLIHIRPRFKFTVPYTAETIQKHVQEMLQSPPEQLKGSMIKEHVTLDIVGDDVHYWSPQLNFRIEPDEDNPDHALIAGLIGPRPQVWTLFMFAYFIIAAIGFFVTSYGISRYMLGEYSSTVFGFPIALIFMLTAYQTSRYGERLGADQIEILKQFVREATFLTSTPDYAN